MKVNKSASEVLSEIYRNAQLSLTSISDILPDTKDGRMRSEIEREYEEYKRISDKAEELAKSRGQELKDPGMMKKAMMWSGIKMETMADNSVQHIAEMMVQGTVMGITSLRQTQSDSQQHRDEEVNKLLNELISMEERFEDNLKAFL